MGKRFIKNIDVMLEKFKPTNRISLIKVDDSSIQNNYNNNPISLRSTFKKEIQSI